MFAWRSRDRVSEELECVCEGVVEGEEKNYLPQTL